MTRGYSIEIFPTNDDKGLVEAFDNVDEKLVYLSGKGDIIKSSVDDAMEAIKTEIIRKRNIIVNKDCLCLYDKAAMLRRLCLDFEEMSVKVYGKYQGRMALGEHRNLLSEARAYIDENFPVLRDQL